MNNQEAKEKAIREAYGDLWETVKSDVNTTGWCTLFIMYVHDDNTDIDVVRDHIRHDPIKWRPKSLRGINSNNGWNRIDGLDSLPRGNCIYTVLGKSGNIEEWSFTGGDNCIAIWLEYFTHWRPLVELPKPIY
ncbi:hypothetical protein [Parapedobacter indicus]|uniref:DUF551 domain-containing protein n=1 Tax=Parapedobacter indicus TaxID=1477437 RepID=A0A1I3V2M8_9SPHI|nr:hypothetical protein [Parapedobacter indicus]PPK99022.1 hypothetical protein CLV26_11552 [Parapedobacter indicus]SFJ88391.1 hypothetical protein SAMN05444682_115125 [Parapedobacter indicus]